MNKSLIVTLICCFAAACGSAPRPVAENSNATIPASNEKPQTVIAHSTENGTPPAANGGEKSKWTQGGDWIDTSSLDADIAKAEKSGDKKALSQAYQKRADALTKARQYAAALGDYRKAVKADPSNGEAQEWIMQITSVYNSMNREAPKEGEEPPPLKKQ
ncbi:MAG: bacterial transcriptional activator domain-containing protein [Acidobacteria bacterium]|nr:bacterial transcriptional activator domain-containing protein [Acidobacteriota bacterium]